MESKEFNRRLAAILFTDVVGYTSMMQRDETVAMAAVRKHHERLQKCVPLHGGEIHQYFGDGSLSIFNSATDAVLCALEFQKDMLQEPVVPVRIGIHIGEIHSEKGNIFGDGVNVASRIESIGQGGTVLFSRDVYEKIRNQPEFNARSIGTFEFKNVDDPIEVYALLHNDIRIPDPKLIEGKLKDHVKTKRSAMYISAVGVLFVILIVLWISFFPQDANTSPESPAYTSSIAVLPFKNLSEDPEESFLGIGLAEDILTQLAQIKGLKVIAQSSSMKYMDYKSEGKSLWDVSKELGVRNIIEGSVRRYGNALRFSVRLIEPKQESVLWAQDFDREIADVLKVQREIALAVSNQLKITLTPEVKSRLDDTVDVNTVAYVNYHRGLERLRQSSGTQQEVDAAKNFFEMAIAADSTFAQAWVGLADANLEAIYWHRSIDDKALPQARNAAQQALKLNPDLSGAYCALGAVALYSHDLRGAEKQLLKALELDPNNAFAYERLGWIRFYSGGSEEAFQMVEKALQLDPNSTRYMGTLGSAYYLSKRYDEGIVRMNAFLQKHPGDNFVLWALAYLYAGKGEYQKAIETLDLRTIGRRTNWVYSYCYAKLGDMKSAQTIVDTLIARDQRAFVPDFMMAVGFTSVGRYDEAIEHLDHAITMGGESFFAWQVGIDPMFDPLQKDPRFQKIIQRVAKLYSY